MQSESRAGGAVEITGSRITATLFIVILFYVIKKIK